MFPWGRGRGGIRKSKLVKGAIKLGALGAFVFFLCEFAIYPIALLQCSWPSRGGLGGRDVGDVLRAMFVADTHLLGPFRGHWFDKLRREWQMHRAFQTAISLFDPEVVFFLGDLFDEGEWVTSKDFDNYVTRFESLFSVPQHIQVFVVAGNHDIGFHYQTERGKDSRFRNAFNTSSVRLVRLKEVNFVLLNSMAMEMDECFLCKQALKELNSIEVILYCQKYPESTKCSKNSIIEDAYNHPILLQHFPLYRTSDSDCIGEDSAPEEEKHVKFRPTLDCLSKESSSSLLHSIKPRLILSGHTHHYCLKHHNVQDVGNVPEYSVPSFSWRNRDNPSFFLGHFTSKQYQLSQCMMPRESTVKNIYAVGVCFVILLIIRYIILCIRRVF